MKTTDFVYKLSEAMEDCYIVSLVGVVEPDEVTGVRQDSEQFGHEYVDQHTGPCGDDFSGFMYFPVEGKYVKVRYQC